MRLGGANLVIIHLHKLLHRALIAAFQAQQIRALCVIRQIDGVADTGLKIVEALQ